MTNIYICEEQYPGKVGYHGDNSSGAAKSQSLEAQVNRAGDVEFYHRTKSQDTLLAVIPKDKRAALADFLAHAQ